MSDAPMMKKRGREGHYCDNRHCMLGSDARMLWYTKGQQRAKERREWQKDHAPSPEEVRQPRV